MAARGAILGGLLLLAGSAAAAPPEKALAHLRDLRVFLDYDDDTATFAAWPVDKFGARLPPDQIARGVRLGLALWASILPDLKFRFVARPEEANLAFRFGDYVRSGFGDGGGRAFLPGEWGAFDPDCGRYRENRRPDGSRCSEWSHNIITLYRGRWTVAGIDSFGNRSFHEHFSWVFDGRRPHFRRTDGTCGTDTAGAGWDHACVDYPRSPHFQAMRGVDLPIVVQHEFGHVLMGHHTQSPGEYVDIRRRPILDPAYCVRRLPGGYSAMVPGDGAGSWWNQRGVSGPDAGRLEAMGYSVSYPRSGWTLVLARPGSPDLLLSDWREAEKALIWPLQGKPLSREQARRQYFLVDVRPAASRPGAGPGESIAGPSQAPREVPPPVR